MEHIKTFSIASFVWTVLFGGIVSSCDDFDYPEFQVTVCNGSRDTICVMGGIVLDDKNVRLSAQNYFEGQCNNYSVSTDTIAPGDSAVFGGYIQSLTWYPQPPYQVMVFKKSTLDINSQEEIIKQNLHDGFYLMYEKDFVAAKYRMVYEDHK